MAYLLCMHDCFMTYLLHILPVLLQNDEVDKLEVFLRLEKLSWN